MKVDICHVGLCICIRTPVSQREIGLLLRSLMFTVLRSSTAVYALGASCSSRSLGDDISVRIFIGLHADDWMPWASWRSRQEDTTWLGRGTACAVAACLGW